MKIRDIVALLTTAVALLVAAGLTHAFQLWSFLGNYTVPWFCGALAIAVLLLTLTAAITGCTPGTIPLAPMFIVSIGASVIVGLGMLVDALSYEIPGDWIASTGEWIGFTTMLVVLFWIPRLSPRRTGEQRDQRDAVDCAAVPTTGVNENGTKITTKGAKGVGLTLDT